MSQQIVIGKHVVEQSAPQCFVIAEIGHNHGGDVEVCKQMFQAAKYAGDGLPPYLPPYEDVRSIGKTLRRPLREDEGLTLDHV